MQSVEQDVTNNSRIEVERNEDVRNNKPLDIAGSATNLLYKKITFPLKYSISQFVRYLNVIR